MRYKAKKNSHDGKWKVVVKFAWFPVKTTLPDNQTMIWLERYKENQRYDSFFKQWLTMQVVPMEYWSDPK